MNCVSMEVTFAWREATIRRIPNAHRAISQALGRFDQRDVGATNAGVEPAGSTMTATGGVDAALLPSLTMLPLPRSGADEVS